jgi:hypothetical protein
MHKNITRRLLAPFKAVAMHNSILNLQRLLYGIALKKEQKSGIRTVIEGTIRTNFICRIIVITTPKNDLAKKNLQ